LSAKFLVDREDAKQKRSSWLPMTKYVFLPEKIDEKNFYYLSRKLLKGKESAGMLSLTAVSIKHIKKLYKQKTLSKVELRLFTISKYLVICFL